MRRSDPRLRSWMALSKLIWLPAELILLVHYHFIQLSVLIVFIISRHRIRDDENRKLMGIPVCTGAEIKEAISTMTDPAKIVLNCMLQKDGVSCTRDIIDYLTFAAEIGVCNVSFIGMIEANRYCTEQYINPGEIDFTEDHRFRIWNKFRDHDYCSCSSGDFLAGERWIRFYYRSPGSQKPPYVRQLVYTADNRLLGGFGGGEILL